MSASRSDPPFTVSVRADFAEDGMWIIDARLQFRDGKTPPLASRLLGLGRLALLTAIREAGLRGRNLGATRVKVHMDTGDRVVDFSPDDPFPDLGRLN